MELKKRGKSFDSSKSKERLAQQNKSDENVTNSHREHRRYRKAC